MGTFAADNDALAPAVQELRRVIGVPRDAAHIEPSVHIARHRQVFHRSAAQPAEQTDIICRSKAFAIIIASPRNTQAPDGVAAAVKGAGVGLLLAADGIHPAGRLAGSRCVTAIRVERTAVHDDVAGQHGAQVSPAVPVHLHPEQLQLLPAADPAGILLRAAARRVAGHRRPVRPDPDALIDHLALVHTVIIDPCQEGVSLLVRALRHHGEEVLAQHLPRIVLAVRLICQRMLFPQEGDAGLAAVPFPGIFLADDRAEDDLYRLVKITAADRAAHQGASASAAIVAITRHLTVECAAGDGAAVRHSTRERAALDGAAVQHFVLERTVLDGAAHLVYHQALERTVLDGALALHRIGKHAVLDAAVAVHRAIEITAADNSGFLRAIARSAAHLAPERAALNGAVVLHLVLERTVLDGAALPVRHLTRKRTAADGALVLHRLGERGGAGSPLAPGDGPLARHLAADGATVGVQVALEGHAHVDLRIAADGKGAPAENMLLAGAARRGDRTAADGHVTAEADAAAQRFLAAVADGAAAPDSAVLHDEHAVVADTAAHAAGHAACNGAAVHDERTVLSAAAAVDLHTAAVAVAFSIAACDAAVDAGALIHLEAAVNTDTHTAAAAAAACGGIDSLTAHDAAALHNECAVLHVHTAAAAGAAAGNDAAVDSLCAARLIQHPQLRRIGRKAVRRCGPAVHHRQLPAAGDLEYAAAAVHLQHIAVQVKGKLTPDLQRCRKLHILRQPDAHRAVGQRIPQRLLRVRRHKVDAPLPCQGQRLRHRCAEVVLFRAVVPAVKEVAVPVLRGIGGVFADAHHLLGVHRLPDLIGHRMSANLAAFVDDPLIESTAADHARRFVGHLAPEHTAADTRRLRRAVLAAVGHLSVERAAAASDPRSKAGVDVLHIAQKRAAVDSTAVLV